jgi:hypothetical protein
MTIAPDAGCSSPGTAAEQFDEDSHVLGSRAAFWLSSENNDGWSALFDLTYWANVNARKDTEMGWRYITPPVRQP